MALDPTPLVEVATFTAAVYPPLIGTPVSAADVAAGEQALANRTQNLEAGKVDRAGDTITGSLAVGGILVAFTSTEGAPIDFLSTYPDWTVDTTFIPSQRIMYRTGLSATKTITLKQTGITALPDGYWLEVWVFMNGTTNTVALKREGAPGGHLVATIGDGVGTVTDQMAGARVTKVGPIWRLSALYGLAFTGLDS